VTTEALPQFTKISPVFGPFFAWGLAACEIWPIPAANPRPTITGEGLPPLLVIGATRDPATPYNQAKALTSELKSAVLLTRDGDGHLGYGTGHPCIEAAANNYLLTGIPSAAGTVCK
jgi:TAP-like protein